MQGKRVYPDEFGTLHLGAGDYSGPDEAGNWVVHPPNAPLGTLKGHAVTEHNDKTITVPGLIVKGKWVLSGNVVRPYDQITEPLYEWDKVK